MKTLKTDAASAADSERATAQDWEQSGATSAPMTARPIDGSGSNPDNPDYGAVHQELIRLVEKANYADATGEIDDTRPNPRDVSNAVSQHATPEGVASTVGASDFLWAWGQFLDHDLSLTEGGNASANPELIANIPVTDPDDILAAGRVIPFTRVEPEDGTGVDGKQREYSNEITAFIDASNVYGSTAEQAAAVRGDGAKLRIDEAGLLPGTAENQILAGDVRAGENIALASLHTLFAREHNRWVDELSAQHPDWTDEQLFNEARARVEAVMQAITYNEFLPILIGEDRFDAYQGWKPEVDPGISIEFSTAVYRLGHTLISSNLQRLDEDGAPTEAGTISLVSAFFNTTEISENGGVDPILRGLADQSAQAADPMIVEELRSFLFAGPGGPGLDLASLNIQRGRDLGLPYYNELRAHYGLEEAATFEDVTGEAPGGPIAAMLREVYGQSDGVDHVHSLDLWVGGLSEPPSGDGVLGELFSIVMVDQFTRLRDGDPFWSEGRGFSPDELDALWSTSLADVIRRNTDVDVIQDDVFYAYDRQGGTEQRDDMYGDGDRDLLIGWGGSDRMYGKGGDDHFDGGEGDDRVFGGAGDDVAYGGAGGDKMYGGKHNDKLYGGADSDELYGEKGDDYLDGGDGNDQMHGGAGDDVAHGGDGIDRFWGGRGDDVAYGGDGEDRLYGEGGDDELHGGDGLDRIYGDRGDDIIYGGRGGDKIYTGNGRDRVVLENDFGRDHVFDFKIGKDKIDFSRVDGVDSFEDLNIHQRGAFAKITVGDDELLLTNLDGALDEGDFLF